MTNSSCLDYVLRLRCGALRRKGGGQIQKFPTTCTPTITAAVTVEARFDLPPPPATP
jgi:hypothetical protein